MVDLSSSLPSFYNDQLIDIVFHIPALSITFSQSINNTAAEPFSFNKAFFTYKK